MSEDQRQKPEASISEEGGHAKEAGNEGRRRGSLRGIRPFAVTDEERDVARRERKKEDSTSARSKVKRLSADENTETRRRTGSRKSLQSIFAEKEKKRGMSELPLLDSHSTDGRSVAATEQAADIKRKKPAKTAAEQSTKMAALMPEGKSSKNGDTSHGEGKHKRPVLRRLMMWTLNSPTRTITLGFALTILTGALLLMLPFASQSGAWTSPLTALFTSTSATCVTGLVRVDTATHWSYFGQIVIILLIQIGGLGIVTVMSFFIMAMRRKINLKTMLAMQESTGSDSFFDALSLIKKIFLITFACEFTGGLIFFWRFSYYMPWYQALWRGIFQAISSFCNAGFDLMGGIRGPFTSLTTWNNDPVVLICTMLLIIIGGLGFVVWNDLRLFPRNRQLQFHSRLVLRTTLGLIIFGTVMFALLDWNNKAPGALGTLPVSERPLAAIFQSVTLRTAGYNSINEATLTEPSKVISILLMFIGAGPASTGGGIKNTTFVVIAATAISYLRGRKQTVVNHRRIAADVFMKALTIFCLGLTIVVVGSFLCLIFESQAIHAHRLAFLDLLFECTSAFATVGCSTAGTPSLCPGSACVLIPIMYLGRVGPASFAMGFVLRRANTVDKVFPEGRTFVG